MQFLAAGYALGLLTECLLLAESGHWCERRSKLSKLLGRLSFLGDIHIVITARNTV